MKGKVIVTISLLALLLVLTVSPAAAAEGEAVLLPGWVAWTMVVVALSIPIVLFFYLRDKGRL